MVAMHSWIEPSRVEKEVFEFSRFPRRRKKIVKVVVENLIKTREWKPAIHLDNRYRLMRNEPMLDADGKETDQIGEDDSAPPSLEEAARVKD
ncbi:unnamed protein product [Xylocopa violacea]|uniref:Uncharacterized protein n=1 Tax=Xylocopa violacea TaxID=135666 RepID=A0ABP1NE52_XYLVO